MVSDEGAKWFLLMVKPEQKFDQTRVIRGLDASADRPMVFELFVGRGFSSYEASSVCQTLQTANEILDIERFAWRYVSDHPGLVSSSDGMMVRAEPAIDNHELPDVMVVVGGKSGRSRAWMPRARQMQRKALAVVLLSDAATAYISETKTPSGKVTTHWKDAATLRETGYYANLTDSLSESSDGVITSAGSGATVEMIIGLIASLLDAQQVAELGNRLLLPLIRKSDSEQPKDIADNHALFDQKVTAAIKLMEDTIMEPMTMAELTEEIGLSTRHLERVFRTVFNQSPARFYKQLRTKRARAMIEETLLPLAEIAAATGFGSCNTLCQAVKDEYGFTPSKMRARKNLNLLQFR